MAAVGLSMGLASSVWCAVTTTSVLAVKEKACMWTTTCSPSLTPGPTVRGGPGGFTPTGLVEVLDLSAGEGAAVEVDSLVGLTVEVIMEVTVEVIMEVTGSTRHGSQDLQGEGLVVMAPDPLVVMATHPPRQQGTRPKARSQWIPQPSASRRGRVPLAPKKIARASCVEWGRQCPASWSHLE